MWRRALSPLNCTCSGTDRHVDCIPCGHGIFVSNRHAGKQCDGLELLVEASPKEFKFVSNGVGEAGTNQKCSSPHRNVAQGNSIRALCVEILHFYLEHSSTDQACAVLRCLSLSHIQSVGSHRNRGRANKFFRWEHLNSHKKALLHVDERGDLRQTRASVKSVELTWSLMKDCLRYRAAKSPKSHFWLSHFRMSIFGLFFAANFFSE